MLERKLVAPNRYEKALRGRGDNSVRALMAGVSRAARLSYKGEDSGHKVIWDTGANVIGPIVFLYVRWVLDTAESMGIRRLYFCARDGQIMKKVADMMKREWGYEIDLRYLYGSRDAWLPAALEKVGNFEWAWLSTNPLELVSMNEICKRSGIVFDDIAIYFKKYGLEGVDRTKILVKDEREKLKKCFFDKDVIEIIKNKREWDFRAVSDYFRQEGLIDGIKFALVDSGWVARSQYALSNILDRMGEYPEHGVDGFYVGIINNKWIYKKDRRNSFMFDWTREPRYSAICYYMFWEVLLTTDHGRTVGYRRKGDRVEPVLSEFSVDESVKWGVRLQHEAVLRYATGMIKYTAKGMPCGFDPMKLCREISGMLISSPSKIEAETYGDIKAAATITEYDYQKIGPKISYKDIFGMLCGRKISVVFWCPGTFTRSGMPVMRDLWNLFYRFGYDFIRKVVVKSS